MTCQLCGSSEVHSDHHLIPRHCHRKNWWKRNFTKGQMQQTIKQAEAAGSKVAMPPTDMFYGERTAKLVDPFGHQWMFGSQIEEVSREEMQHRFYEMMGSSSLDR